MIYGAATWFNLLTFFGNNHPTSTNNGRDADKKFVGIPMAKYIIAIKVVIECEVERPKKLCPNQLITHPAIR